MKLQENFDIEQFKKFEGKVKYYENRFDVLLKSNYPIIKSINELYTKKLTYELIASIRNKSNNYLGNNIALNKVNNVIDTITTDIKNECISYCISNEDKSDFNICEVVTSIITNKIKELDLKLRPYIEPFIPESNTYKLDTLV